MGALEYSSGRTPWTSRASAGMSPRASFLVPPGETCSSAQATPSPPPGSVSARRPVILTSVATGLVLKWGEIAPTLEMKVSYLNQSPGAELIFRVRQHQISVFIFQERAAGD